jgi:hypothetical protein
MKTTILLFLTILLFTMAAPKKKQAVTIQLFYTNSYCMGMRPTEEMLAELAKPKIYPDRELTIMKMRGKKQTLVATVKANREGLINIDLPAGEYSIMDNSKSTFYNQIKNDRDNYAISSEVCVKEWLSKPILTFSITKKAVAIKHTFNKSCYLGENPSPCISYIGPQKP